MMAVKLKFNRRGVRLFFITFAVQGRAKVLSRLLEGVKRPELTAWGAAVKSLMRQVHRLYPYLGTSDYAIMPDHVHLLLVADFDRCPGFNPLVFIHWFEDAAAYWVNAIAGGAAPAPLADEKEPAPLPPGLYTPPDFFYPREAAQQGVRGSPPPKVVFSWEPGFWLDLAMGPRQLKAIRHYIRLNPSRALWKARNPDCFVRRAIPTARLVENTAGLPETVYAIGDISFLGSPFLLHVRLTLRKSVEEHRAAIDEIVEKARRGQIPVSGFISPGEKELLRRLKAEPRVRFVKTLPCELSPRYDPSAEDSRELAAHRLVIISLLAGTTAPSSREMRESPAAAHGFRRNCLAMNDFAAALCARLGEDSSHPAADSTNHARPV